LSKCQEKRTDPPASLPHRYHIPTERFAAFDLFTNLVNIPAALLSVVWLRRRLTAAPPAKRD